MLVMMVRILLLIGLLKLLLATNRWLLCGVVYACAYLAVAAAFEVNRFQIGIEVGISLILACLYFWALTRIERVGTWGTVCAIGGIVLLVA